MQLRDLYDIAEQIIRTAEVTNQNRSTTDRSDLPNIGHTIPWSDEDYDPKIGSALSSGDMTSVARMVRRSIRLITERQRYPIGPATAQTIEPQVRSQHGFHSCFHVIVDFRAGVKTVLTDFDDILELCGMHAYLGADPS